MKEDFLEARQRAEDILLGALGLDCEASLVNVSRAADSYSGLARWPDGEEFDFQSEDEITELEQWALSILLGKNGTAKTKDKTAD